MALSSSASRKDGVHLEWWLDFAMLVSWSVMSLWATCVFGSILLGLDTGKPPPPPPFSGGWELDPALLTDLGRRCDVARIAASDSPSVDSFRPYVIVDAAVSASATGFAPKPSALERAAFVTRYGSLPVAIRDVSSAVRAQFGHARLTDYRQSATALTMLGTISELLSGMKSGNLSMHFDVSGHGELTRQLMVGTGPPSFVRAPKADLEGSWRSGVSLGARGSGLAFHTHGPAWQITVWGAKLWVLSRKPPAAEYLFSTPGELLRALRRGSIPGTRICVTREGEAMVLPPGYFHATVNLGETIAVGGQRSLATKGPRPAAETVSLGLEAQLWAAHAYAAGNDTAAEAFFRRALELEPLSFKTAANFVAAKLGAGSRAEAAAMADGVVNLAMATAPKNDAAFVTSYLGLVFFEGNPPPN